MGGKVWSNDEESYFWHTVVTHSPKRVGVDLAKPEKSWDQLADEMRTHMGEPARRNYNGSILAEHWLQNTTSGKRQSPNAGPYVQEYLAKKNRGSQNESANRRSSTSTSMVPRRSHQSGQSHPARRTSARDPYATTRVSATTAGQGEPQWRLFRRQMGLRAYRHVHRRR
ncbi:hypothetical protein F5B18DRAFT_648879 [Nemania serpens]|nr:hypothetical protein F5B18DRAFT_648879 [Nemania serpens]